MKFKSKKQQQIVERMLSKPGYEFVKQFPSDGSIVIRRTIQEGAYKGKVYTNVIGPRGGEQVHYD